MSILRKMGNNLGKSSLYWEKEFTVTVPIRLRGFTDEREEALTLSEVPETYRRIGMPRHIEMTQTLLETVGCRGKSPY
jgi:hypothetical protein